MGMTDAAAPAHVRDETGDRGRHADRPGQVPVRGWKDVLVRLKEQVRRDDVPLLAAGVAFFALLALVPSLVALVSVYGLVADPNDVQSTTEDALQAAPAEVQDLVSSQLEAVVDSQPSGLRFGVIAGLALALWAASSGMKHLMGALTLAYGETEDRKFLRLRGVALALTIGAVVVFALALAGLVAPNALDDSGAQGTVRAVLLVVRWLVLGVIAMVALSMLYRFGPDRDAPTWRWTSPGAVLATVVALVASIAFSIYTSNFGSYNETYGALGAVVVLMLWLFITSFAVILGAELNCELERQTTVDTTQGPARPMGERGAYAADTVGPSTG
jgi:membrane protein